jgi:hypothetical protein
MTPTPFMIHRSACEHCRTMPHLCETGARILRRAIERYLGGTTEKETNDVRFGS